MSAYKMIIPKRLGFQNQAEVAYLSLRRNGVPKIDDFYTPFTVHCNARVAYGTSCVKRSELIPQILFPCLITPILSSCDIVIRIGVPVEMI